MTTSGFTNQIWPNSVVDGWYNQGKNWQYGRGMGFSLNTGKFTQVSITMQRSISENLVLQVVWASTTKIGVGRCAQSNFRRGGESYGRVVVVAKYSPSGNVVDEGNKLFDANILPIGLLSPHSSL